MNFNFTLPLQPAKIYMLFCQPLCRREFDFLYNTLQILHSHWLKTGRSDKFSWTVVHFLHPTQHKWEDRSAFVSGLSGFSLADCIERTCTSEFITSQARLICRLPWEPLASAASNWQTAERQVAGRASSVLPPLPFSCWAEKQSSPRVSCTEGRWMLVVQFPTFSNSGSFIYVQCTVGLYKYLILYIL